jgi:hypothetical protein
LSELEFTPAPAQLKFDSNFSICSTLDGYQASVVVTYEDKSQELWNVRQDSKIWKQTESELVAAALARAGDNQSQLRLALNSIPIDQREGL